MEVEDKIDYDAMVFGALKNFEKKLQKWIDSFEGKYPCIFCGNIVNKAFIVEFTSEIDSRPKVEINKSLSIKKELGLTCEKCLKEFKRKMEERQKNNGKKDNSKEEDNEEKG